MGEMVQYSPPSAYCPVNVGRFQKILNITTVPIQESKGQHQRQTSLSFDPHSGEVLIQLCPRPP